jgi:hypothetical protein
VRKWVNRRNQLGACSTLVNELRFEDAQQFQNFIRMSAVQFEQVLDLVRNTALLSKIQNCIMQFQFMID